MNMSVPEACDVDSREKWDVTLSNKYFFEPFFCDFLQKILLMKNETHIFVVVLWSTPLWGAQNIFITKRNNV